MANGVFAQSKPTEIRLDYATYNPVSLILKERGWIEQDLSKDGIKVTWTLSQGANQALEFLNGNPIYGVYLFSKPEWAALVALPGSGISKIQDLKGKKIAATLGTQIVRAGLGRILVDWEKFRPRTAIIP
jgi:sulfonate transport system substrate-binding protein